MPSMPSMPSMQTIEHGDLFFTAAPDAAVELPQPFLVAGRLPRLLDAIEPAVAVLGFGLGAVAHLMLAERPDARLVGVEPDAELTAAVPETLRRRVTLESTDALSFLERTRRRFDLVFDDCFVLAGGQATRPPELTRHAGRVAARLTERGIYVRNLLPEAQHCLAEQCADLRARFDHVALRTFRDWENVFAIASSRALPPGWRDRLK
jgi:spermidine synthase